MNTKGNELIFTDGKGNYGYKVRLSDRILYNETDGYLYCNDVVVGNVGVQYYKGYELPKMGLPKDVTVEVHREAEDVFDEISMDSLKGIPVTLRHPKKLLNSNTTSDHIKGAVYGEPKRDGDNLVTNLVIYDQELIDLVAPEDENGERKLSEDFRDLSLGYRAKLEEVKGKPYTYKQKNILYNHVAVLEAGRQANAVIRDNANPELEEELKQEKEGKGLMGLFRLKGKTVKRNEDAKEVVITDQESEIEIDFEDAKRIISESMYHSVDKHESYNDPEKEIITETVTKTVTTEQDKDETTKIYDEQNQEIQDKKEIKDVEVKDKAYFVKALREAQALPDGEIKTATIADLNQEFADAFPAPQVEIKDGATKKEIKPVNSKDLEGEFNDGEKQEAQFDFRAFENESRNYYRKLTDPFAHESWEEFNKHYASEVRKGRADIN